MARTEFDLIEHFFQRRFQPLSSNSGAVALGIGDDGALLGMASGSQLVVSSDMMLAGRHFLPGVDPAALGHKALAVNLSDLAAMGARPLGFLLALALPPEQAADEAWLDALSHGMLALARRHGCPLVGGDTTAGPLNLCITVLGQVPAGQALLRSGARAGDEIWVSGEPGLARLALGALRGEWSLAPQDLARARQRLERPEPRVALGLALRGLASSAIDVSDGLLGDLGHILKASGVGASLELAPLEQGLSMHTEPADEGIRRGCILAGGDDYELVFTAAPALHPQVLQVAADCRTPVTRMGRVDAQPGLRLLDAGGRLLPAGAYQSFDHFADTPPANPAQ